MNNWKLLIPLSVMLVAGCAGQSGMDSEDGMDGDYMDGSGADDDPNAFGTGVGADGEFNQIGDDRETVVMNERIIYFEFDSAEIDEVSIELLKLHGSYLADNPGERVRLEGHADERGSREYNIGLGERRAVSVQSVLLINGATSEQLTPVSFGEERPANPASSPEAWQQNRRVEIVYER